MYGLDLGWKSREKILSALILTLNHLQRNVEGVGVCMCVCYVWHIALKNQSFNRRGTKGTEKSLSALLFSECLKRESWAALELWLGGCLKTLSCVGFSTFLHGVGLILILTEDTFSAKT